MREKNSNRKNPAWIAPVGLEGTTPDRYQNSKSSAGTPAPQKMKGTRK